VDQSDGPDHTIITAVASIVSAYLGNPQTALSPDAIPSLIRSVMAAVREDTASGTEAAASPAVTAVAKPVPAVPISETILPDHIVCLEDGKRFKMLRSHLKRAHQMTPEQYRIKWGLPPDYPVTAQNHAARRSKIAREMGLGRSPNEVEALREQAQKQRASAVATPVAADAQPRKKPEKSAVERYRTKRAKDRQRNAMPRKTRSKTTPDTQT